VAIARHQIGNTLISVFEASSGLEAHMILNLLEQAGIKGRIEGEHLQGGVGELQAMNYVRVLVSERDVDEALNIIRDWESVQPSPDQRPNESGSVESRGRNTSRFSNLDSFLLGIVCGVLVMYLVVKLQGWQ
jgi:hypothetical protein